MINKNKGYEKGVIDENLKQKLISEQKEAVLRAKKLKENKNPWTTVYRFIEEMEEIKKKTS